MSKQKILEGNVIFLKDEGHLLVDTPHIVNDVNRKDPEHILYESESFSGNSVIQKMNESEFELATAESLDPEYVKIGQKEFTNIKNAQSADLYEATGIQIFNGKDYVESCYDEWRDFFSEDEEFSEYIESLGTPLKEIELDKVYAGDVVNEYAKEVESVEELEKLIENKLKTEYREGSSYDYRHSEEYFQSLVYHVGKDKQNDLNEPIIMVEGYPDSRQKDNGFYTEESVLKIIKWYDELEHKKGKDYGLSQLNLTVYSKDTIEKTKYQNITGKEYIKIKEKEELNKTPFYKENTLNDKDTYYSDLLKYYQEQNLSQTKLRKGEGTSIGATTQILDTGKYSYEYEHTEKVIDKINNHGGYIEKSFEANLNSESKKEIEKDLSTEMKNEVVRAKEREELIKKQRIARLQIKGNER